MKALLFLVLLLVSSVAQAALDPPELSSFRRNTTGATGYGGAAADVQLVRYSPSAVYVSSSGVPSYTVGPWAMNPNVAAAQGYVFKIPRQPAPAPGAKTATPLGPIGVWVNGVPIFNALDAMSYQNAGVWHQNAVVLEAPSFDSCLGHPAPGGVYHHHQHPVCLDTLPTSRHSAILGFAFDGYPVYGPYGYASADGTGGVRRITSGYRTRTITQRRTLPNGTAVAAARYGPDVSPAFPLGTYVEDFEYVPELSDLDAENGRFAVTPEYPGGTYAYYTTVNADGSSAYPYVVGTSYHGVVATENLTSRGHVTVTEPVTTFAPATTTSWLLPSSARAAGQGGAFYTTDLTVANTSANDARFLLRFLGHDSDGRSGAEQTFTLAAGRSVTYSDVLGTVFRETTAYGAILVQSDVPALAVSSQTSTPSATGGTFGQSVPTFTAAELITSTSPRSIVAIRDDDAFRTNLVLANATESSLAVSVTLLSEAGDTLATAVYTLPPLGMTQVTNVVRELGVSTPFSGGRLVLATATAGGSFAAYAASIDNVTNDPRTLSPR